MNEYFMDLHVHIGMSDSGKIVKMATSRDLTIYNVCKHAFYRKGLNILGIVDCINPYVLEDIYTLIDKGELVEIKDGGLKYKDDVVLILGAEIETKEQNGKRAHILAFFPYMTNIKRFAQQMRAYIANIYTNSSVANITSAELVDIVQQCQGICIPAHIFTPHKSYYGSCTDRLEYIFGTDKLKDIYAVELGLSADTYMACHMSEIDDKVFLTNSDAHSLSKLGREYNMVRLSECSYAEVLMALRQQSGRAIVANYGLNPKLGKYHRTFCIDCKKVIEGEPPVQMCPVSESHKVVMGVLDRLWIIKDRNEGCTHKKPAYIYQVPLEYIPGIGPKTIDKLIEHFGSEMNVLHKADSKQLNQVLPGWAAEYILSSRKGILKLKSGGGGKYGKLF